mgnify:CR=1 FL=1
MWLPVVGLAAGVARLAERALGRRRRLAGGEGARRGRGRRRARRQGGRRRVGSGAAGRRRVRAVTGTGDMQDCSHAKALDFARWGQPCVQRESNSQSPDPAPEPAGQETDTSPLAAGTSHAT